MFTGILKFLNVIGYFFQEVHIRPYTCEFNILLSEYNLVPLFKTKYTENIWKRLKRAKRKV